MKYKKYAIEKVKRSAIADNEFNPRKITEKNLENLKKSIKKYGLMQPVILNRQSMRVVGGNQRLKALDLLENNPDYELDVVVVDMDDETELKANIALNQQNLMGEYDKDLLANIKLDFPDINFENDLFFEKDDINYLFGLGGGDDIFPELRLKHNPATPEVSQKMREQKAGYRQEIKERRANGTEVYLRDAGSADYLLTIVFKTNVEKRDFCKKIGLAEESKFITFLELKSQKF
jgi:hypothetical protein